MAYEKERDTALKAVQKAAGLCAAVQTRLSDADVLEKKDRSPVTIADFGSQAVINMAIRRAFPDDAIVAEEDAAELRNNPELSRQTADLASRASGDADLNCVLDAINFAFTGPVLPRRFWVLDPIDGTKGFLRKEQYAIALALVEDDRLKLGVLGCPNFSPDAADPVIGGGRLFYAVTGQGAFMRGLNGGQALHIHVDEIEDPAKATFCESVEKAHASHEDHQRISDILGIVKPPFRLDSQAKYAAVAAGSASVYLRMPRSETYREKIWDHAAGAVVVREAGGEVTDFNGKPLDFGAGRTLKNNRGVLAANRRLHRSVIAAIDRAAFQKTGRKG